MKRINSLVLVLIAIGIQSNLLLAQRVDTLYYDSEWNLLTGSDISKAFQFEVRNLDRKGRQNGMSRLYNNVAQLISETEFSRGKKSGEYILYEANGIKTLGSFKDDLKSGPWMKIQSDTILLKIDYFVKDVLVDTRDFVNDIVIEQDPDVLPEFPGGQKGWNDFLRANLNYPQQAKTAKIQGPVFMQFFVLEDGKVAMPTVTESPSPLLSDEGLRILYLSPNWKPATKNGSPVASLMKIRIVFKIG